MKPADLRADVPALADTVYLNTGASGPSPRRVVDAVTEFAEYHKLESPAGDGMYEAAGEAFADAREAAADLLGADADAGEIALTGSTMDGVSRFANAVDWAAGDTVVRTDLEHPAGVIPWERLREAHGVEVEVLETERGRLDLDDVKSAVADARLVCLSSLSWNYGTRLPVEKVVEVAHDAGALVLVDAVQSVGQVPVDVREWGADAVACAGHKWLLGPWGTGMLYVRADVAEDLEPMHVGYFGAEAGEDGEDGISYVDGARRFEMGTASPSTNAGLAAAVEVIQSVGLDAVQTRVESLTDRLKEGLGEDRLYSPAEYESGLVSFRADDPEATVERLADAGVRVRTIPDPEAVRASVHVFNTPEDVDALLDAL